MEGANQWQDPLLLTDVTTQQQRPLVRFLDCVSSVNQSSQPSAMADGSGVSLNPKRGERTSPVRFSDPIEIDMRDGRSMLGFSPTSPDLVVCADSPLIPKPSYEDSPECLRNELKEEMATSIVLSLEEGIDGITKASKETTNTSNILENWNSLNRDLPSESSFELVPPRIEQVSCEDAAPAITINAGEENSEAVLDGITYLYDSSFDGGDVIRTSADVGNGGSVSLYQSARVGNFSYKFSSLKPGKYIVDLHFADIVFTDGPGMRMFDVFIQEERVISGLDIYARVGANKPLVVSGLEASVKDNGLSIRFQGFIGDPIVSGISVRKNPVRSSEEAELAKLMGKLNLTDNDSNKVENQCDGDTDLKMLKSQYVIQQMELEEARRAIEELERENQVKSKECQEATKSLQELQNELMRKSMHVGSLAFAIEGQVKEKSKWFSTLRDLQRRLKLLKLEHVNLSDEARKYKKCLTVMDEIKCSIENAMREQVNLNKQLECKFVRGEKERKELYNKVLELKGNIRVYCRCRPLNADEVAKGASMVIDFDSARDGELTVTSNGWPKKTFKFDAVFGPEADQADVFEDTAGFAASVLDGYNVCIFAYGQTGTGKTFTMEGTKEAPGVNYRTLEEVFSIIGERQKLFKYEISVSVLEVYNEQIRDLLCPGSQPGATSKRLEVRQLSEGVHHIPGLTEAQVSNLSEAWDVLRTGSNARAISSTNANEHSSRSHCIHCVMVKGENSLNGECTRSKLWLVDLAGSERIAKTEAQGDRLREAQNINRSLSALGDVISALATKSPHVPFRNSKLTHLLQDSLGGDSKTLMFVQISPNDYDLSETLCSLNFASRVKGIELGPAKKQFDSTEFLRYKQMVEKTKQEAKCKDIQMKRMEETIQTLEARVKEREVKNKNLQERVKGLESQLLVERKLARQHVDTKIAEQQQQTTKQMIEDHCIPPPRPPLTDKPLGSLETNSDPSSSLSNLSHSLTENTKISKPSSFFSLTENTKTSKPSFFSAADSFFNTRDSGDKENNPSIAEKLLKPKRIRRASVCPVANRPSIALAPRRNSLIPLPSMPAPVRFTPLLPPQECKEELTPEKEGVDSKCLPEANVYSPKIKSGSKMLNTVLRRSLHKKLRSPLLHRKGGVSVGTEKARVSIGSRGKIMMARRVARANGSGRAGMKDAVVPQKQSHKDKERGWNF